MNMCCYKPLVSCLIVSSVTECIDLLILALILRGKFKSTFLSNYLGITLGDFTARNAKLETEQAVK